jgi:SAM-dependent methyltransferase
VPVHDAAARGFGAGAAVYLTGRPDYPPRLTVWLRGVIRLNPARSVVDLGAGTGKFLPSLRATGARVIAIEPVEAMRSVIATGYPDVAVLAGTAEHIPLGDGSVDAVVCAQAFHWFANAEALAEIHRVLRPGGMLGLVWNVRDESVAWVAALTQIIAPFEGDAPRYRSGEWRRLLPSMGFVAVGESRFQNAHEGAAEQVIVDRTLSISFIAALPEDVRGQVRDQVRELIGATPALAGKAKVAFPYETVAFAYRRSG